MSLFPNGKAICINPACRIEGILSPPSQFTKAVNDATPEANREELAGLLIEQLLGYSQQLQKTFMVHRAANVGSMMARSKANPDSYTAPQLPSPQASPARLSPRVRTTRGLVSDLQGTAAPTKAGGPKNTDPTRYWLAEYTFSPHLPETARGAQGLANTGQSAAGETLAGTSRTIFACSSVCLEKVFQDNCTADVYSKIFYDEQHYTYSPDAIFTTDGGRFTKLRRFYIAMRQFAALEKLINNICTNPAAYAAALGSSEVGGAFDERRKQALKFLLERDRQIVATEIVQARPTSPTLRKKPGPAVAPKPTFDVEAQTVPSSRSMFGVVADWFIGTRTNATLVNEGTADERLALLSSAGPSASSYVTTSFPSNAGQMCAVTEFLLHDTGDQARREHPGIGARRELEFGPHLGATAEGYASDEDTVEVAPRRTPPIPTQRVHFGEDDAIGGGGARTPTPTLVSAPSSSDSSDFELSDEERDDLGYAWRRKDAVRRVSRHSRSIGTNTRRYPGPHPGPRDAIVPLLELELARQLREKLEAENAYLKRIIKRLVGGIIGTALLAVIYFILHYFTWHPITVINCIITLHRYGIPIIALPPAYTKAFIIAVITSLISAGITNLEQLYAQTAVWDQQGMPGGAVLAYVMHVLTAVIPGGHTAQIWAGGNGTLAAGALNTMLEEVQGLPDAAFAAFAHTQATFAAANAHLAIGD